MPKRSVTDQEIGLIKAMLARGMKNRDIQFYFNRQDRLVNSGRITQIRDGTYGPGEQQASEADLNAFLETFTPSTIGAAVNKDSVRLKPTPMEQATALFAKRPDGKWILKGGENDEHECKQDFDPKKFSPVLRAIAALSNNKGGFLFLGVSNKDCCVQGVCADFESIDIAKIMDKVKTHLSPTPCITSKDVIDLDGMKIGFIHVEPHPNKPVIVCRDDGEYVFASVSQPRLWLPIFYFVRVSGITNAQVAAEVQKVKTSQKGKQQNVIDRLNG